MDWVQDNMLSDQKNDWSEQILKEKEGSRYASMKTEENKPADQHISHLLKCLDIFFEICEKKTIE